jgi:hypothetical protein
MKYLFTKLSSKNFKIFQNLKKVSKIFKKFIKAFQKIKKLSNFFQKIKKKLKNIFQTGPSHNELS